MSGLRLRPYGPAVVLAGAAAYFAVGVLWVRARQQRGVPSFDTYTYVYPNVQHALNSLRAGGGLLWNPYQDCGQPFFAFSTTGLLYPVNLFFAVLDRETALVTAVLINLLIGGAGMFLLGRELRLATIPALCGALAFQLGGTAAMLAAWSPMHLSPYVWIPVAMWRLERVLRRPTVANGVWLGVVLTLQLLPGFPQISVFTYQVIALRTAWALVGRRLRAPLVAVGVVGLGCALPAYLAAIQLLPSIEVTRASVRGLPLDENELGHSYTWQSIGRALHDPRMHAYPGNALVLAMAMLAAVALGRRQSRAVVLFYAVIVVLYGLLSLGPNGVLFPWYAQLPMGRAFRMPQRFLWMSGFALAVLTAFGADSLLRAWTGAAKTGRRGVACLAVGAALFLVAALRPPTTVEWWVIAAFAAAGALLLWRGQPKLPAVIVLLAVLLDLVVASRGVIMGLRSGDVYLGNADAFALLRERMTPQDRVLLIGAHSDLALLPKSASLFRVPSVYDYEPVVSRTYAEFFTWLRTGSAMRSIVDWYYPLSGVLPPGFHQRLLDQTAARYLLVGRGVEKRVGRLRDEVVVASNARWTLYENPGALPRARYVPRLEIVPPGGALAQLSVRRDAESVAWVEEPPASGFLGEDAAATGTAAFVVDEPERVVVEVEASAPGFLFLADQYASGWEARVNGAPAAIVRGNHTFRLVEVPAGRSQVEFRYRPRSVYLGALVSGLTIALLLAGWAHRARGAVRA